MRVFEGVTIDLRGDGRRATAAGGGAGRTRGRSWRRRGAAVVQLPGVPRDHLRGQLSRRDRDADQLAAGGARGPLHPRALAGAGARLRRRRWRSWDEATTGIGRRALRACRSGRSAGRSGHLADLRADGVGVQPPARGGRRRRPPADVHVGHHRPPEGRDAHPRQPGLEEPRAYRGVRLHQRGPRAGVRPAVPRGRA